MDNPNQVSNGTHPLIRKISSNQKIDKVVLIGNGAIRDGSLPLWEALNAINSGDPFEKEMRLRNPDPMTFLARFSFLYRAGRNEELLFYFKYITEKIDESDYDNLEAFLQFRARLAKSYFNEEQNIDFSLTNEELLLEHTSDANTGIITLNWDKCLWSWENEKLGNLIQLHGMCDYEDSLILPSELILDDDIFELIKNHENKKRKADLEREFEKYFRPRARNHLVEAHREARKWFDEAEELVVYGVAFNPYDAELIYTADAWRKRKRKGSDKRVTFINPNKRHRDIGASLLEVLPLHRLDINPITREIIDFY